jgi:hypothetical protein
MNGITPLKLWKIQMIQEQTILTIISFLRAYQRRTNLEKDQDRDFIEILLRH